MADAQSSRSPRYAGLHFASQFSLVFLWFCVFFFFWFFQAWFSLYQWSHMPQSRCFWLKVFSTEPLSALLRPGIACQAVNRSTSFYRCFSVMPVSFPTTLAISFYFTPSVGGIRQFLAGTLHDLLFHFKFEFQAMQIAERRWGKNP